jgi:hypothetical protein
MSRQGIARNATRVTTLRQHMLDRYKQHLQAAASKIAAGDRIGAEMTINTPNTSSAALPKRKTLIDYERDNIGRPPRR